MVAKDDLESSKTFCIFLFYVLDKGMRIWAGRVGHIPGSLIKMMITDGLYLCVSDKRLFPISGVFCPLSFVDYPITNASIFTLSSV